jgi:hypothetical protein
VVEHTIKIEVATDLLSSKAMQFISYRSSAKQIGLPTLDFASTRPTEGKVNTAILVKPMHFVEELRDFLHLINHHLPTDVPTASSARSSSGFCR